MVVKHQTTDTQKITISLETQAVIDVDGVQVEDRVATKWREDAGFKSIDHSGCEFSTHALL